MEYIPLGSVISNPKTGICPVESIATIALPAAGAPALSVTIPVMVNADCAKATIDNPANSAEVNNFFMILF
jgi:hypothetical protein